MIMWMQSQMMMFMIRTASSRIRGLQAVTRQLPRVKSAKTETWRQFEQNQGLLGKKSLGGKVKTLGPMNTVKGHPPTPEIHLFSVFLAFGFM